jgi:hypothetical protein
LQVQLVAVDRDNPRPALGQEPHRRGADDPGGAGDDGNPAIQSNAIGHARRSSGSSGISGFSREPGVKPRGPRWPDYFICRAG